MTSHPESMAWPFGGAEPIQLFVKMMNSQAPPMEINVDANDIIKIIHEKILVTWKIPVTEQKLFYGTKQLQYWDTLKQCSIQNKACLELTVRWDDMDGTSALLHMVHQMSSSICRMCQGESDSKYEDCCSIISQALDCMTEENSEILSLCSVPATLVMLYSSPIEGNKFDGNNLIRLSMDLILMTENQLSHDEIASLGLEFCNLLREVSSEDPLYNSCRTMLAEYLEDKYEIYYGCYLRTVIQILLFAVKLSQDLSNGLANLFYRSEHIEPLRIQVRDLGKFLCVLRKAINVLINEDEDDEQNRMVKFIVDVIKVLFHLHLKDMEQNLTRLADMKQIFEKLDTARPVSLLYLAILNELNSMPQLVESAADEFKRVLEGQKNSLQIMIKNIMRSDDYDWLLEHIDVLDSESRMHLIMMKMFPEKKLHNAGLLNTLFCWSEKVDKKLFNAFKGKDLTDPKVLHHWLCKVCQVLFEPKNLLFRVCPDYPTEFYPNPELQPEPFHLDCFNFAGKVIALALKHEIQVGVALDRVFLMQLAGKNISLEDVKNADPCFYNRCKEFINKDDLSTLESPKVKFGFKTGKTMKLYPSKGYFESLVRHCFVRSISKQVSIFSEGFQMIFGTSISQLLEDFKGLELKDLNWVLKGNVNAGSNFGKKGKSLNHECNESDPLMSQLQKIRRPRINMKDCQLGDFLGSGSFGKVYEGYVADCPLLAVKVAPLLERKKVDQIEQEIALLRQFSHPNIVKYFGTDKDEMNLYIFLELVGAGSLEKHYQKFQLQDSEVSLYTKQILKGLKYLHDRNVVHGDIKCANILVDVKKCVKIADFGLSRVTNLKTLFKFCWWNPRWMPPEVVNGKGGGYGFKIDIWSVGCTVLEMSTRKIPYSHLEPGAVDYSIGEGKLPPLPDSLTEHSRDFILQCLQVNPNDRPTAAELLEHPFVKGRCP
ncbi:E3 ubiquitin-protein ligase UPL5 isoform X1 [Manihot esculenta]|uniref:mitogen-activated protein kinase kinase kinase n=1 Tax=Manihot esculenta TaxID=3983 RepID=A0A2C9V5A1_MANES|nr:E3 ubiquitin-protein ligase UPL5 isoform X1 [Manihot esculenta]XP_021625658.1 E3 ubiquitin-protein ligase UPL5 isoform X1 [Manihot esculenta]OAY39653.1 hypothetical protein MANES_10G112400v8 [Manihot esculenta]